MYADSRSGVCSSLFSSGSSSSLLPLSSLSLDDLAKIFETSSSSSFTDSSPSSFLSDSLNELIKLLYDGEPSFSGRYGNVGFGNVGKLAKVGGVGATGFLVAITNFAPTVGSLDGLGVGVFDGLDAMAGHPFFHVEYVLQ